MGVPGFPIRCPNPAATTVMRHAARTVTPSLGNERSAGRQEHHKLKTSKGRRTTAQCAAPG